MQQLVWYDREHDRFQRRSACWTLLVLGSTLGLALESPARLALGYPVDGLLLWAEWLITAVLSVDVALYWCIIYNRQESRLRSMQGWRRYTPAGGLLIDLLAAFPWQIFPLAPGWTLLRLGKIAPLTARLQAVSYLTERWPTVCGWGLCGMWGLLVLHWLTCGWIALGGVPTDAALDTQYLLALYWCVTTLTTVGYGDMGARTNAQILYTIMTVGCGLGLWVGFILRVVRRHNTRRHSARHRGPYDV